VPNVADEPTFQKTLQAWAPPVKITELDPAVMSVDASLKTNTALGSPPASKVKVPVSRKFPALESYTPGTRVWPPRAVPIVVTGVWPAALSYASTKSDFAFLTAEEAAVYLTPVEVTPVGFVNFAVG
jgi:hypothetical protein